MSKHTHTDAGDSGRLEALHLTALLDSPPEEAFDRITRLASRTLGAPIALISLVDSDRQFFKSSIGLPEPWATMREIPLSSSFCRHPATIAEPLIVEDAREHPLVRGNPAVADLGVAAYAGVPISTSQGHVLGSLCVIDTKPRKWTDDEVSVLHDLTASVVAEIELRTVVRTARSNAAEAEAAQRQVERILQSITDAFFALDHEWRFTYLNDEAEALLQRTAADLLGRSVWEEFPEAVGSTFDRMYHRAVEEQQTVQFVEYFAPLESWFEVRAYPSADGLSVYFRNINERIETEEALRYQNMLTRTITDNATSALFMMDANGRCTFMNPAAEAMIGFMLDEIRDMPLHDAIHHHHHPDGRPYPMHTCPIDRALPEDFSVRAHEDVFFRKNGEMFPVVCAAAPIFEDGRPVGTVVEVRDVTEEKRADQALRQSEERFRSLIEATAAIVWTTPASGELQGDQPGWSRFTGQTPEEYTGWGWIDAIHPDDRAKSAQAWQNALENRATYEIEHRVRNREGEYRLMLGRGVPIIEPNGQIREWVGLHTDVTEQRRIEWHQRILAQAGEALATSLNPKDTIAALARTVVPQFAEWCAIYLVEEDGGIRPAEIAHADPDKVRFGWELLERYPPDPSAPTGTANVARTGTSEIVSDVPDELLKRFARDEEHLRLLQSLGLRTYMSVPLQMQGRVLGVLGLYSSEDGRRYDNDDLLLAEELARRAALALESAQLFTERERALADIASLAAQRSAILGQITDGVIVTDVEGRITFINEAARELHGVAELDVPVEQYADRYRLFTLEGQPYPTEQLPLARAVRHRETVLDAEWKIRRADGSEVVAQGSATPVLDPQGRMLGAVLTVRDVTTERRLRQQVEAERARLQTVFQEAPAVIALYSGPEHTITMTNPIWEVMVGKKDVLGKPFQEAFPELAPTGLFELLDRVYETGQPYVGNETLIPLDRKGDGIPDETYWNFLWQPLRDMEGRVTDIMVHAVEITDQVRARQEVEQKAQELSRLALALERSNQELDQFAYVTSHDLKAPLRGIGNLSQWIEEDWGTKMPDEVREHLQLLRGRVNRMEGLIDGILQYSRATRVTGEVEAVDVNTLVADAIELMDPPKNITFEVQPGLPTLRTVRLPLQQVFMNLIGNAIKYTRREDAEIRVQGRDQGSYYEFVVSDNGPGIAPEFHERIFGIFQTLEARDKVEGTGISLSLVKKVVEHRRGRVWVESEEGAGSALHFTWPVTP